MALYPLSRGRSSEGTAERPVEWLHTCWLLPLTLPRLRLPSDPKGRLPSAAKRPHALETANSANQSQGGLLFSTHPKKEEKTPAEFAGVCFRVPSVAQPHPVAPRTEMARCPGESKPATCDCSLLPPRGSGNSPWPAPQKPPAAKTPWHARQGTARRHSTPTRASSPRGKPSRSGQRNAERPNPKHLPAGFLTLQPQASAAGPFLVPAADAASRWPSRHAVKEKKKEQSFSQDAIV